MWSLAFLAWNLLRVEAILLQVEVILLQVEVIVFQVEMVISTMACGPLMTRNLDLSYSVRYDHFTQKLM